MEAHKPHKGSSPRFLRRLLGAIMQPAHKKARTVLSFAASAALLFCIVAVVAVSALFLSRPFPLLGILVSTLTGCLLMVPVTLLTEPFFRDMYRKADAGKDAQIDRLREENSALLEENERQRLAQEDGQRRIALLENLTLNMQTYQNVFRVCLRNDQYAGTIKQRDRLSGEDYGSLFRRVLGSSRSYDEVLSVMDCTVTYQRGVDLEKIRVAKINEDTVVISGITPAYTSEPQFEYRDFLSEVRHVRLDKDEEVRHISIESGAGAARTLARRQNEYKALFEDEFLSQHPQDKDAEEIITRAQNFIRIILQPVYRHVEFDNAALAQESLPLLEYLHKELDAYRALADGTASAGRAGSASGAAAEGSTPGAWAEAGIVPERAAAAPGGGVPGEHADGASLSGGEAE